MSTDRKGFLTEAQEQQLDDLIKLSGVAEAFDGVAIRLADNQGLERLKPLIPEDVLPIVYQIIDEILGALKQE